MRGAAGTHSLHRNFKQVYGPQTRTLEPAAAQGRPKQGQPPWGAAHYTK